MKKNKQGRPRTFGPARETEFKANYPYCTQAELAARYGIKKSSVQNFGNRWKLRKAIGYLRPDIAALLVADAKANGVAKAAKDAGISVRTVYRVIEQHSKNNG